MFRSTLGSDKPEVKQVRPGLIQAPGSMKRESHGDVSDVLSSSVIARRVEKKYRQILARRRSTLGYD